MRFSSIRIQVLGSVLFLLLAVGRTDASDLVGTWWGEAPVPGGGVFVQLDVVEVANPIDGIEVSVSIPKLGLFASRPRSIDFNGDELDITTSGSGVGVEIRVSKPDADGRSAASFTFTEGPPRLVALARCDFTVQKVPAVRTLPGAVRHDGMLELPGGGRLPITVVFAEWNGVRHGLIDIPAQGVQGLVLLATGLEAPKEVAEGEASIESHPEARGWRVPVPVEASLVVRPEGDSLVGRFRQGPVTIPVAFKRMADAKLLASRRPQDPVPPFPYREIELEVPTPAGHVLAGTLLVPGLDPAIQGHPAVVLVTGSGQQNRDEEVFGHRPFRVLADRLARAGIVSLRFDDRGIAGSTGDFATATTLDFAFDAAAVLAYLQRRPETDPDQCGMVGHSEGGAVAAIVAAGMAPGFPDVRGAFVVSIAGTGVDGGDVLADQLPRTYRAMGVDEASIESISEVQRRVLELIRDPDSALEAKVEAIRELQRRQLALQGAEIDQEMLASLEAAGVEQLTSPWMETFVRFDPAEAWGRVRVPVLAVNGTLDTQVSSELNLGSIVTAVEAGGGRVEAIRFEGLNHMLQPAITGGVDEYGSIDITMDEKALAVITAWIGQVTDDANPTRKETP